MPTSLWCITHSHKFGRDLFHVVAEGEPEPAAVVEAGGSTYDPGSEEDLTIIPVDLPPGSVLPTLPPNTPFILCV